MISTKYRRWGCAGLAILLLIVESIVVAAPWFTRWQTARWLAAHVVNSAHIVADTPVGEIKNLTVKNLFSNALIGPGAATWSWQFVPTVDVESPLAWLGTGAHYLVVDDRTVLNGDFSKRVQALVDQGATLLYQTPNVLNLEPRQAVFWTFRPDHLLNVTFNGSLQLIGYNIILQPTGTITLLLHWYTLQPPTVAYHIFVHLIDPTAGEINAQADADPGGATHPTNTWNKNEIVFESIVLPTATFAKLSKPYHVRLGLYQLDNGARATITDESTHLLGDHIDLDLP